MGWAMVVDSIEDRERPRPAAMVMEDETGQEAQGSRPMIRMIWTPLATMSEKMRRSRQKRRRRGEKTVLSKRKRMRLEEGLNKDG